MSTSAGAGRAVALPCPTCRRAPSSSESYGVTVACDNCFDADCVGDPPQYVALAPCGSGMTLDEAIRNWNDIVEQEQPGDGEPRDAGKGNP